jgi:hypothetical protein
MGEPSGDLDAARRLLPEGSKIQGEAVLIPKPGAIGLFVGLPGDLTGFVDVLTLPLDADAWSAVGTAKRYERGFCERDRGDLDRCATVHDRLSAAFGLEGAAMAGTAPRDRIARYRASSPS